MKKNIIIDEVINSMNDEDMKNALLNLASEGLITGSCEFCKIPLHFYEITDSKCETCGDIKFSEITWMAVEDKEDMS